ncbi:MAG TPA: hypothetical protein VLX68_08965 [Chitinivibrionales bacterium]|nr:hypothetical protein [Chitinivibrionales bacterium]
MSTVIWVLGKETMREDDYDHFYLLEALEKLDAICVREHIRKISEFVDRADGSTKKKWHRPDEGLAVLKHLVEYLDKKGDELADIDAEALKEELADCIDKIEQIKKNKDLFQLTVVM